MNASREFFDEQKLQTENKHVFENIAKLVFTSRSR